MVRAQHDRRCAVIIVTSHIIRTQHDHRSAVIPGHLVRAQHDYWFVYLILSFVTGRHRLRAVQLRPV